MIILLLGVLIMLTAADLSTRLMAAKERSIQLNAKMDSILLLIANLRASGATQEQLDALEGPINELETNLQGTSDKEDQALS